jgi:hypothetical protein
MVCDHIPTANPCEGLKPLQGLVIFKVAIFLTVRFSAVIIESTVQVVCLFYKIVPFFSYGGTETSLAKDCVFEMPLTALNQVCDGSDEYAQMVLTPGAEIVSIEPGRYKWQGGCSCRAFHATHGEC